MAGLLNSIFIVKILSKHDASINGREEIMNYYGSLAALKTGAEDCILLAHGIAFGNGGNWQAN